MIGKDVQIIVAEWLKENGYEGINGEYCGCPIDDLMPCDGPCASCEPAMRYDCDKCKHRETCDDAYVIGEGEGEFYACRGWCDFERDDER